MCYRRLEIVARTVRRPDFVQYYANERSLVLIVPQGDVLGVPKVFPFGSFQ